MSRKWTTLEDAYKKAIDSDGLTGKAPTKFQFIQEMGELIGGHHDVDFPVIGTAKGVIVTRPVTINTIKPPSSPTLPQKKVCRLLPPVLHIF